VTSWEVAWSSTGSRSLAALPEKVAAAAVEFIYGPLLENPQRSGKPLRFELEGLHAARRGDYRVIYEIDDVSNRIVINVIAHRSDVYRHR
jgi:mRNA-degrading endonuclease RelE of RelBE toxin-antitoxin system